MGVKLKVASLEAVPESLREFYIEDGGEYRLDAEDVPDVSRLNAALAAERRQVRELRTSLKSYEIDGRPLDPTQYTATLSELEELRQRAGTPDDKREQAAAEKVRREMTAQLEKITARLNAAETEREQARQRLRQSAVERAMEEAATKAGVRQRYLDDVKLRANQFAALEDEGGVVMVGPDGQPKMGDNGQPITPEMWVQGAVKEKPEWLEPSTGGGARGGSPQGAGGRARIVNRNDTSAFLANIDDIAKGKTIAQ